MKTARFGPAEGIPVNSGPPPGPAVLLRPPSVACYICRSALNLAAAAQRRSSPAEALPTGGWWRRCSFFFRFLSG
ncbi:hypothetical protein NL676_024731 [Syzygium grande]|nr:hypothetical protein NL676_024731 [Syzygium grande]